MSDITVSGNTLSSDGGSAAGLDISGAVRVTTGVNTINVGGAAYANDAAIKQDVTAATASVIVGAKLVVCNRSSTITLTLPLAAQYPNRTLQIKTIQAQAVNSDASNVVPIDSATAGTAILPATDGAWAQLFSDGTNWVITARG
jgi:predicted extracellular nuclease